MSEQQYYTNQMYPYYYPYQAYYPAYDYQALNRQQQQYPQADTQMPQATQQMPQTNGTTGMLPPQESYIENILRLNKGKIATVYMTFENSSGGGNEQVFKGEILAAGRDHIILSDPETGMRYLLLMVYLDYITFDEPINYQYPFSGAAGPNLVQYPPR
ncbi:spore coat protein GerQ [Lentibacillus sp. N15]|uniref:spore coat protein GerQ n=1 Tax=Lentibacillus songyuanensis TaxID=3136161 RepID=UPI0031BAE5C0